MIPGTQVAAPFPGLRPFEAGEADLFFGRDEQISELLGRLGSRRFLAVVGTSGSGKSSLVRAGLIPALDRGYLGSSDSVWRIAIMRPGTDPYSELARELSQRLEVSDPDTVLITLRRSSLGLTDFARQHLRPTERLFLLVDQFEELFRFRKQARDQGREDSWAFVKLLLAASNQSELPLPEAAAQPVYIVLTMRSDYLGKCSQFPGLPQALNDAQYLVPRLSRDQQREAIEGPLAWAGAEITPLLVQRLLNDVGDNPDQLPVLQHALLRTWEASAKARAKGDRIDLSHYEEIGGMEQALNCDAEDAFKQLRGDPKREMIARRLFQRLVEPGTEDEVSRRPTKLSEIVAVTESSASEVRAVIEVFRARGFLFLSHDNDPIIDISHESLIRQWARLKQWVKEEGDSAAIYTRLADSAVRKLALYRDPELSEALRWRQTESPNAAWSQRYTPENASALPQAIAFLRRSELWRLAARALVFVAFAAISTAFVVAALSYYDARRQRGMAVSARNEAEKLVEFMVINLRDKLEPIGRLDVLDDVSQRVNGYYKTVGSSGSADHWRRRAVAQRNYGYVLMAQGKLTQALQAYVAYRSIAESLVRQEPSITQWQRDLSDSHSKVGDVRMEQDQFDQALQAYEAERRIDQHLVQQDPSNRQWQRELSAAHHRVGDALMKLGQLDQALQAYEAGRSIAERLVQQDPSNAEWQRGLFRSHSRAGDVRMAYGKLAEALQFYGSSLGIAQRLAQENPSNAEWQRELSVSYNRVGNARMEQQQPKLDEALQAYEASRRILGRLARQDPSNAEWQRELSVSYMCVGDVRMAQGKLDEALQAHEASRSILGRLARQDPSNAQWQRELASVQERVAKVRRKTAK